MILKMNNTVSSLVVLFACLLLPSQSALCNPSDSASDSCRAFFVDSSIPPTATTVLPPTALLANCERMEVQSVRSRCGTDCFEETRAQFHYQDDAPWTNRGSPPRWLYCFIACVPIFAISRSATNVPYHRKRKRHKMKKILIGMTALFTLAACIHAAAAEPLNERRARPSPDWVTNGVMYQVQPRAFTPEGTLKAATARLPMVAEIGVDIIYMCPVFVSDDDPHLDGRSPRQKKSGMNNPRNPYRMKDYYHVDPEYGTDDDLKEFIAE